MNSPSTPGGVTDDLGLPSGENPPHSASLSFCKGRGEPAGKEVPGAGHRIRHQAGQFHRLVREGLSS